MFINIMQGGQTSTIQQRQTALNENVQVVWPRPNRCMFQCEVIGIFILYKEYRQL